jgi:vacuolar iron transporter family protein
LGSKVRSELHGHIRGRGFIAKAALGVSDGLVTNLALLSGFAGAQSEIGLIRSAGVAAMLAGAISMFFGGVLAGRAEVELYQADRKRESSEIEMEPEEEKQELREFYIKKGLSAEDARMVVDQVSRDKNKFLEDLMIHELHLHETSLTNPYKSGLTIGGAFLAGSLMPLWPYLVLSDHAQSVLVSLGISLLFLSLVGGWKARIAKSNPWRGGLETISVGVVASGLLYLVGFFVGFF